MYEILIIVFLVIAIAIVGLVLIQQGKGADMGASFGAGASATLFGSSGAGNFLTRLTTLLGLLFFVVSIILANLSGNKPTGSVFDNLEEGITQSSVVDQNNIETEQNSINATQQENSQTSDIPE